MDFSSATSALRTLKFRPKVQEGAVSTSAALLALLDRDEAHSDAENRAQNEELTGAAQRDAIERGLTTLLVYGRERWEPIAVFAAIVRDRLEQFYTVDKTKTSPVVDERQVPFSDAFLMDVVRTLVRDNLEHWEPRVRMNVAKLLGALARWNLAYVTHEFTPLVVESVQCFLTRSPDFEETGFDEMDDNVSVNGMESPTNSVRGTPRTPSTPHRLDDVTGWKALESSLAALKYIMRGSGAAFLAKNNAAGGTFTYLTDEIQELVMTKAVFHVNRYVRVVGLDTITTLCELAPTGFLESHDTIAKTMTKCIVRGMQDNWSQVRYAASLAVRAFLIKLDTLVAERDGFYALLVPRLCLNRYYVAERVQKHSQETWRLVMGDRGRDVVARYADEIVAYYIEMTNHCVREAACHCIAELATKIDKTAIRRHVPALLDALLYSFRDNSWLVRDAACLASSQFVLAFPEESKSVLSDLYTLWFDHLSDEIWSVREDAAIALGNVIRAYGDDALCRVTTIAEQYLVMAKTQPAMCQHEYDELQKTDRKHMSKQAFSCCSLEPKIDERHQHHEKEPWAHTDGAIYLVRELCSVAPSVGVRLLPLVADVAILRHFPQTATLQETIWKQLPWICEALGKRIFKQSLELFLDPLVFTLQGSHRLALFAARDCVAQLSKAIGPNIFMGRLQVNPTWLETIGPIVPMPTTY